MTQLPNNPLKSSVPKDVPINSSISYLNQPTVPQFVQTQQNTPLSQNMPINGVQKPNIEKDTSKCLYIYRYNY